jgi:TonB-dependent SusC/RagA subfamily outer membrane receptor
LITIESINNTIAFPLDLFYNFIQTNNMKKIALILLCVVFISDIKSQINASTKDRDLVFLLEKHFTKMGSLVFNNNLIQESSAERKFTLLNDSLYIFYTDPNDYITGKPIYDTIGISLNELGKVTMIKGKGSNQENGIGIQFTPKKNKIRTAESNARNSKITQQQLALTSGTVVQKMQGQAAGVVVGNDNSPGGVPKVRIRGFSSVNSNSNPLYIVDDVPINNISSINPDDIASVEVLKDASATAFYGVRGANGVVIIKTKKGGDENVIPNELRVQKEIPYTLWVFGERANAFSASGDNKKLIELLKEKIQVK